MIYVESIDYQAKNQGGLTVSHSLDLVFLSISLLFHNSYYNKDTDVPNQGIHQER